MASGVKVQRLGRKGKGLQNRIKKQATPPVLPAVVKGNR